MDPMHLNNIYLAFVDGSWRVPNYATGFFVGMILGIGYMVLAEDRQHAERVRMKSILVPGLFWTFVFFGTLGVMVEVAKCGKDADVRGLAPQFEAP
jgi:hypothetical protein